MCPTCLAPRRETPVTKGTSLRADGPLGGAVLSAAVEQSENITRFIPVELCNDSSFVIQKRNSFPLERRRRAKL